MLNCILDLQILNKYIHRTNTPPPLPLKKGGTGAFFFIMKKSIGRKYRYKFTRKRGGGWCAGIEPLFACGILTEVACYYNILIH